tara:strand:+ start:566 stop:793 length:228 start_codon:yes stop_codon:yes gene_type:complete
MKVNDIERYEDMLLGMLDLTENSDAIVEDFEDRFLQGELLFLVNIIRMMLDSIPEKKQAYDIWKGLQTRLVEDSD